jgi:hypothetical protein
MCVIAAVAAILAFPGAAPPSEFDGWFGQDESRFSAYCGLYSLHNAILLLGGKTEFSDLLKPQYIGSRQGSSAEELIRAATDHKYFAQPLAHMTCSALLAASRPLILHVRANPGEPQYNHWVLFTGTEGGRATIIDGRKKVLRLKYEDLAAVWDGLGIVVTTDARGEWRIYAALLLDGAFYLGLLAIITLGLLTLRRRIGAVENVKNGWRSFLQSLFEIELMLVAATALLGFAKLLPPAGWFEATRVIQEVENVHRVDLLPVIDSSKSPLEKTLPNCIFIDVRAIPKNDVSGLSVGLVVRAVESNCGADKLDRLVSDISHNQQIVVCCDRLKGCGSAENVCNLLWLAGYREILVLKPK